MDFAHRANGHQLVMVRHNTGAMAQGLKRLRAAHAQAFGTGSKLVVGAQLTCSGRYSFGAPPGSPLRLVYHHPELDRRLNAGAGTPLMTDAQMEAVAGQYATAARVAREAGFVSKSGLPPAETLKLVQERLAAGDPAAREVYESMGVYLGYALGLYAGHYDLEHVLLLGRVMTGDGGGVLMKSARRVLEGVFPECSKVKLHAPNEREKRHGQAVAAASLPPGRGHGG
ncbi:MAG: hypothetical protein IH899_12730 [Planctomycetes bacterium]|nr:hypothetical protein [Planctomycetota bacterium]